ncbi:hypothetical protein UFOVP98_25 [uncultured Caudovirales phage]|jgi:hypothetical protein|uniref:Uncharacterized protein n=1 Tax=uncultured Caudovirales phage TaxID=2100421 RepID=A0A6J5L594_9CAUD|nr:hypothetical protein UFOVP98_25 [uncultured Caudovirales phage]CAB4134397.1 hypothetical protein UFOVP269_45 [uncultured Caudovirales phage]
MKKEKDKSTKMDAKQDKKLIGKMMKESEKKESKDGDKARIKSGKQMVKAAESKEYQKVMHPRKK